MSAVERFEQSPPGAELPEEYFLEEPDESNIWMEFGVLNDTDFLPLPGLLDISAFIEPDEPRPFTPYRMGETGDRLLDSVKLYIVQAGEAPLLTHDQEKFYGKRVQKGLRAAKKLNTQGDLSLEKREELEADVADGSEAELQLFNTNVRLVISIANRYSGTTLLDRIQDGNIGLMKAIKKFKQEKGFRFSTYAAWWIRREILRGLAENERTIPLPLHLHEAVIKMRRLVREFAFAHGYEPDRETMERLYEENRGVNNNTSFHLVMGVFDRRLHKDSLSLSMHITSDDDSGTLGDLIVDPAQDTESSALESVDRQEVQDAMDVLSPTDKRVLQLYFGIGVTQMTLKEIAQQLQTTESKVRTIKKNALEKLKQELDSGYLDQLRENVSERVGSNGHSVSNPAEPEMHFSSAEVPEQVEERPRVVSYTIYDRAREALAKGVSAQDPQEQQILELVSTADRKTFKKVSRQVASRFGIPEGDVITHVLQIVHRLEQSA